MVANLLRYSGDSWRAVVSGEARGLWPAAQRGFLWSVSLPYGWATGLRNRLYDRGWKRIESATAPVVSVGNLTLGGTGKTPFVEYLARFYQEARLRVAILSRGYGSDGGPNDEALVLQENLPDVPHLQGKDRVSLAARAVKDLKAEVLILDDGFQHRRLGRDLDIVLIDATQPWGYGRLFPRGMLRESVWGLHRAGLIVITRSDQVSAIERGRLREVVSRFASHVPIVETTHRPLSLVNGDRVAASLEGAANRPVAAFCGIGNPRAFRMTLAELGLNVADLRVFPDHHAYTPGDVAELERWVGGQARDCVVVTTQKDLVKLRMSQLAGRELWALRIQLQVEAGQEALDRQLKKVLSPGAESTVPPQLAAG